jgi:AcrR family transcriptional regulator
MLEVIMVLDDRSPSSQVASPRATRRAREVAQRRLDMLAAAADVFARKGYEGAQMAEIAAAAEVSLASLYAEFRGKHEIYQAAIDDMAERLFEVLRSRVEAVADPGEALLVLIDTLFECLAQDALLRLVLSGSAGVRIRSDRQVRVSHAFTEWVIGLCRRAVRRGGLRGLEPSALGHALIGSVLQAAAFAIDHEPERPLTQCAPPVRAIFARLFAGETR